MNVTCYHYISLRHYECTNVAFLSCLCFLSLSVSARSLSVSARSRRTGCLGLYNQRMKRAWRRSSCFCFSWQLFAKRITHKQPIAVMPRYRRTCRVYLFIYSSSSITPNSFLLNWIVSYISGGMRYENVASQAISRTYQHILLSVTYYHNAYLVKHLLSLIFCIIATTWFCIHLLCSGNVHPNPGPLSSLRTTAEQHCLPPYPAIYLTHSNKPTIYPRALYFAGRTLPLWYIGVFWNLASGIHWHKRTYIPVIQYFWTQKPTHDRYGGVIIYVVLFLFLFFVLL